MVPLWDCQHRGAVTPLHTAECKPQRIERHEAGDAVRVQNAEFGCPCQVAAVEFRFVSRINDASGTCFVFKRDTTGGADARLKLQARGAAPDGTGLRVPSSKSGKRASVPRTRRMGKGSSTGMSSVAAWTMESAAGRGTAATAAPAITANTRSSHARARHGVWWGNLSFPMVPVWRGRSCKRYRCSPGGREPDEAGLASLPWKAHPMALGSGNVRVKPGRCVTRRRTCHRISACMAIANNPSQRALVAQPRRPESPAVDTTQRRFRTPRREPKSAARPRWGEVPREDDDHDKHYERTTDNQAPSTGREQPAPRPGSFAGAPRGSPSGPLATSGPGSAPVKNQSLQSGVSRCRRCVRHSSRQLPAKFRFYSDW